MAPSMTCDSRIRALALALTAAMLAFVAGSLLLAEAATGLGFAPPQRLSDSDPAEERIAPAATVDARGVTTIAWLQGPASWDGARVMATRIDPSGSAGEPFAVSAPGDGGPPVLALDARDRVTVAWTTFDDDNVYRVRTRRIRPEGTLERARTLLTLRPRNGFEVLSSDHLDAAVDARNRVTVAAAVSRSTRSKPQRSTWRVHAVRLPAGGDGDQRSLFDERRSATGSVRISDVQLADSEANGTRVLWRTMRYETRGRDSVRGVTIAADGSADGPRTLFRDTARSTIVEAQLSSRHVAIVRESATGSEFTMRAARIRPAGGLGPVRDVARSPGRLDPRIAALPGDRSALVWEGGRRVKSTQLDPRGKPGRTRRISRRSGAARGPEIAVDQAGRATVVWRRVDDREEALDAVRLAKDGAPGAVTSVVVDPQARLLRAPQIAVDRSGRPTVAWTRIYTGEDGTYVSVIEAARGTGS